MWKLDLPLNFRQLSVWLRDLPQVFVRQQNLQSSSVNIPCGRGLLSTCVNFSCGHRTYCQLSMHPWDLSPIFRASEVPSINFPYVRGRSINFRQLSVHPRNYPSNFCGSEEHCVIFIKHFVRPWDLPSTSINFSCVCASEFLLTFHAAAGPIVNFPCIRGTFHLLTLTFCAAARSSVNFPCGRGTFRKLPSIFCAPAVLSVRFCLLSVNPRDHASTFCTPTGSSVKRSYVNGTFCKLLSTFLESAGHSVNFRQISIVLWDLSSTFSASMGPFLNFCQLSVNPRDLP